MRRDLSEIDEIRHTQCDFNAIFNGLNKRYLEATTEMLMQLTVPYCTICVLAASLTIHRQVYGQYNLWIISWHIQYYAEKCPKWALYWKDIIKINKLSPNWCFQINRTRWNIQTLIDQISVSIYFSLEKWLVITEVISGDQQKYIVYFCVE